MEQFRKEDTNWIFNSLHGSPLWEERMQLKGLEWARFEIASVWTIKIEGSCTRWGPYTHHSFAYNAYY